MPHLGSGGRGGGVHRLERGGPLVQRAERDRRLPLRPRGRRVGQHVQQNVEPRVLREDRALLALRAEVRQRGGHPALHALVGVLEEVEEVAEHLQGGKQDGNSSYDKMMVTHRWERCKGGRG